MVPGPLALTTLPPFYAGQLSGSSRTLSWHIGHEVVPTTYRVGCPQR
jgi:hypothetical protein